MRTPHEVAEAVTDELDNMALAGNLTAWSDFRNALDHTASPTHHYVLDLLRQISEDDV